MADTDHILTMTVPAEIAFVPALFEKRKANPKSEPRWEIALLMVPDHPDLVRAKQICLAVAEKNQPGITANPAAWKFPWSKADEYIAKGKAAGKDYDNSWMAGKVLLNAHATKFEPRLAVWNGRTFENLTTPEARERNKDKFYMGCEAYCEIAFIWYPENNGKPGVTAYVNEVASLNKGQRRGGGKSAQDKWGAHVGPISGVEASASIEY